MGPARATIALLPVRFFLGATFLYAGLDKLLDPTFLDPAAPTSLHALRQQTTPRRRCSCTSHTVPMFWQNDGGRHSPGSTTC